MCAASDAYVINFRAVHRLTSSSALSVRFSYPISLSLFLHNNRSLSSGINRQHSNTSSARLSSRLDLEHVTAEIETGIQHRVIIDIDDLGSSDDEQPHPAEDRSIIDVDNLVSSDDERPGPAIPTADRSVSASEASNALASAVGGDELEDLPEI